MSELLLQTIVERLDAQDLLLQTMSKDADKAQIEWRKKMVDLSIEISSHQPPQIDLKEIKQLSLTVESLSNSISQSKPVKSETKFLYRKSTWLVSTGFVIFVLMAWGWGYTFRCLTFSEMDASKYRYLQRIDNPALVRFCRQADSLFFLNSGHPSDTLPPFFAGEKRKGGARSNPKTH